MFIPLTKPYWDTREVRMVSRAVTRTTGVGDGIYSQKLVAALKKLTGATYIFPTTSCTHGLELAMAALDIQVGDEVIMPSFTMSSTANAVVLRGATPVFAEIDDKTYNIDPVDVKRKITKKTRGIIVVHYAGMPVPMEAIQMIARKHKLFVVEDAAHAIGVTYKRRALGAWGDIGVYSFHGTKNVSCGEGGVVLTHDKELAKKMEIYRANGTNRSAYLRGEVDKYSWVRDGSSYFLSDILASIVLAQLTKLKTINTRRKAIAARYLKAFMSNTDLVSLPVVPTGTQPNWHIFALRFTTPETAAVFASSMRKKGIAVSYHYVPLHNSVMGRRLQGQALQKLPVTEIVSQTLIRLPIYPSLTTTELSYIIASAQNILKKLS